MRRFIAFAVIALHVLLVWWLALGFRTRIDRVQEQPQWVSLWFDPPPVLQEPPPADPQPRKKIPPQQQAAEPPPVRSIEPLAPPVPVEPKPESTAPLITPAPPANFARAAGDAARRMVEAEAAAARKSDLNPPPKVLAKPCVPKKRSMEWKGDENPGLHWYGPIPILVTEKCAFTLGAFSCDFGKHEANGHLFDDMKDPGRPTSSVPDPDKCD